VGDAGYQRKTKFCDIAPTKVLLVKSLLSNNSLTAAVKDDGQRQPLTVVGLMGSLPEEGFFARSVFQNRGRLHRNKN